MSVLPGYRATCGPVSYHCIITAIIHVNVTATGGSGNRWSAFVAVLRPPRPPPSLSLSLCLFPNATGKTRRPPMGQNPHKAVSYFSFVTMEEHAEVCLKQNKGC